MATINSKNYSSPRNINLKEGCLRFGGTQSSSPFDSTSNGLYINSSNQLVFSSQGSDTTVGAAGGGTVSTWDTIYDNDKTLDIDGGTLTFLVSTNAAGLTLNKSATGAGTVLALTNSGTGNDIGNTVASWYIKRSGATGILEMGSGGTINATDGALTIGALGANTTFAGGVVITSAATIAGTADSTCFTITAGDVAISNGKVSLTNDDTDTALTIVADAVTTGNVIDVNADALTNGNLLHLDSTAAGWGTGFFIDCYNGAASVFTVGLYGAVTIAGNAATNIFTITTGDVVLSDTSITLTDADDGANTLVVHNDAATTTGAAADLGVVDFDSESLTTGVLLNLSLDETNLTSGFYLRCYGQDAAAGVFTIGEYGATTITTAASATSLTISSASATSDILSIAATALTTGDAIQITQTGEVFAAGELLKIANTEDGNVSATPKTGNLCSISSSVTATTANTSLDYDGLLIARADIANLAGFTLTSAGSHIKIAHTATQTAGTLTDTVVGLEVLMSVNGTGDGVEITHAATAGKALDIIGAATSVSDVLVTCSGAKADNKACIEATNNGNTAAGGSILRITNAGTPAAATSYLVDFDYSGATMTNNPVAVYINNKNSTGAALQVTGSGAMAGGNIEILSTATGALGAVLKFDQTANSAANDDVCGRLLFTAQDDANAAESYARIDVKITDVGAANPDADLIFYVDTAGTLTQKLLLDSDVAGIAVGTGAANAIVQSSGNYDLILQTGNATTGTITIVDGTNGDITIAPNGTGKTIVGTLTIEKETILTKDTRTGAGAVSITTTLTEVVTTGVDALTLANGVTGQLKIISMITDGGEGTLTPTAPLGYATIKFNDVGDTITLIFLNSGWQIVSNNGCTVA